MKKVLLLTIALLFAIPLWAKDGDNFEYEGVTYTIISESAKTCKTKEGGLFSSGHEGLKGQLKLYPQVPYNGNQYTLTEIGRYSFYKCSDLTGELDIPQTVTKIGSSAFESCSGLTGELILPEGLTEIGSYAFESCSGLTGELKLPEGLTEIGSSVFYGCSGFTGELRLPEGLTEIGSYTFSGCTGFNGELSLPEGLLTIGNRAFYNCRGLTGELKLPEGLTEIGEYTFYECSGFNGKLSLPEGLLTIGSRAFYNCRGLTGELKLPEGLTEIGSYAFYSCSGLTGELNIPEGLTEIGEYAFYNCSGFNGELSLPEGLLTIGPRAFYNCRRLTGKLILPEGLTEIGEYVFNGCSGLTGELILPEGLTEIGSWAFTGCTGFTEELRLPEGVTKIGEGAFAGCTGFTGKLRFPEGVTEIGSSAFAGCTGFTGELKLPKGLTRIEARTFTACTGFTDDLIIQEGVITIADEAFMDCDGFKGNLILPETLKNILYHAFENCSNFTGELIIPDNVQLIEEEAFFNCKSFTGLKLSNSLKEIDDDAFRNCTGLSGKLSLPEGLNRIGGDAFRNCSGLTGDLRLPEGLKTIGPRAFYDCKGLSGELIIPSTVTYIYSEAFNGFYFMGDYSGPRFQIVVSNALVPPVCQNTNVFYGVYNSAPLIVPDESIQLYQEAEVWKNFKQIKGASPKLESIIIRALSMEGLTDKHNLKSTEELNLKVIVEPQDAEFEIINWKAEPDYIEFSTSIVEPTRDRSEVTAKVKPGVTAEKVIITATVDGSDVSATYEVSISELIPGDANDSGEVNVADVGIVISEILKMPRNENFCFVQADVNADTEIDVADQMAVQNLALGKEAFALTRSEYSGDYGRLIGAKKSQQNIIEVSLENASSYVILQADILIPEGMELAGIVKAGQANRHELQYRMIEEGKIRLILYSPFNETFIDSNQPLFTLQTVSNGYGNELTIENIITADIFGSRHELEFGFGDDTNEAGIELPAEDRDNLEIYDLQGRRLNSSTRLLPGIYIVNGKKVVVK